MKYLDCSFRYWHKMLSGLSESIWFKYFPYGINNWSISGLLYSHHEVDGKFEKLLINSWEFSYSR